MSKQEKSRKPLIIGIIAAVVILAVLLALLLTQCIGGQGNATVPTTTAPSDEVPTYQLYWNLDRAEYDGKSEAGMSSRMPEADGYFHVRFFCEGEEVTLKVADRKLINAIDVQSLMGLEFDEDGIVVGVFSLDDMPLEKVGWQFYVQSAARTMIKLNSSESLNGMEVLLEKLDPERIWDMSGKSGPIGCVTEAMDYDKVMAVQNMAGEVTHVFIFERPNYMLSHEAYCEHCKETVVWSEWVKEGSMPLVSGHYQLQNDIQLKTQYSMAEDVKLCIDLNGHRIDGNKGGGRVISMHNPGTNIAIMDTSEEQTGVLAAHGKVDQGGVIWVRYGALYLYGGTLDASDAYGEKGGIAVDVPKEKFFYMFGGTIIGGRATYTYNAEKNTYGAGMGGSVTVAGKFVMHDGEIRDGYAEGVAIYKNGKLDNYQRGFGGNLRLSGTAEFEMNGGVIKNGIACCGGGNIYADSTTELNLNGGSIIGGMIYGKGKNGGSIYAGGKSVVNLKGTSIYGGVSYNCGGNVYLNATLNMTGGYIGGGACYDFTTRKHKPAEATANLFVVNGKFNMWGGTIAGHVSVVDSSKNNVQNAQVTLGGVARIDGSKVNRNLTINGSNDGVKFVVTNLYKGAKIGVNTTIGIFTQPTKQEYKQYFYSDIKGADILYYKECLALGKLNCICGKSHDGVVSDAHINGCKGEVLLWAPWTSTNSIPTTTGNYFLTNDVTTSKQTIIGAGNDVKLDLFGKNITLQVPASAQDGFRLYRPEIGAKLSITDTTDAPGALRTFVPGEDAVYPGKTVKTKAEKDDKGNVIKEAVYFTEEEMHKAWTKGNFGMLIWCRGAEVNIHNGILDGSHITGAQEGMLVNIGDYPFTDAETGVTTNYEGVFNMYGGTILGGYTKASGNIAIAAGAEMNIYGGTISGGRAFAGGNINVLGTLNMYGGTVTKGVVDRSEENVDGGMGGNINIASKDAITGTMNMYGGVVSDGSVKAGKKGGGHGGNIHTYGTLNATGGIISGGVTSSAGGNIASIGSNSVIKLDGVQVLDGTASVGGNIAIHVRSNKGLHLLGDTVVSGGRAFGTKDAGGGNIAVSITLQAIDQDQILVIDGATISDGTAVGNGGNIFVRNGSYNRTVVDEKTGKEKQDRYEITVDATMKSGTISGGICGLQDDGLRKKINGGSIYSTSKASFTLEGGSITGGDCADIGGNIYSNGTLNIKGGTVADGSRLGKESNSANIAVVNGTLAISGGVIKGNVGVTATKTGAAKVLLSGKPVIEQAAAGLGLSGYGDAKAPMIEIDGVLKEGSSVAVSGSGYISTETPKENLPYFNSKTDTIIHYNKCLFIGRNYCICGKSHGDVVSDEHINGCDGTIHAWERWTSTTSLPTATGNFYLSGDVTTKAQTTIFSKQVRLNLDGHDVTLQVQTTSRDAWRLYRVDDSGTLAITDITENPGTLRTVMPAADAEYTGGKFTVGEKTYEAGSDEAKAYVKQLWEGGNTGMLLWARGGQITMHNGIADGSNLIGNKQGQAISILNHTVTDAETGEETIYHGKFTLYGGTIYLGQTSGNGPMDCSAGGTEMNLYGGTIYGGKANLGGALYVAPNAKLTIDGATIIGGEKIGTSDVIGGSAVRGGLIFTYGKVDLKSGTIKGGAANRYSDIKGEAGYGGNICIGNIAIDGKTYIGSLNMTGGTVSEGQGWRTVGGGGGNGGNIHVSGKFTATGGTIIDGQAETGGNIGTNYANAEILLDGVELLDGYATGNGGNLGNNVRLVKSIIITDKTTVSGGVSEVAGGNIFVSAGAAGAKAMTLEIAADLVDGSANGTSGGNLYVSNSAASEGTLDVTITGNVSNGSANTWGGNICLVGGKLDGKYNTTVTISGSDVTDGVLTCTKTSNASGGNIYMDGVDFALYDATVSGGTVHGSDLADSKGTVYSSYAGNLDARSSQVLISGSIITGGLSESGNNSKSYAYAGNLYLASSTVELKDSFVTEGTLADRYDAGNPWKPAGNMMVSGSSVLVENTEISGGYCVGSAANIYMNAVAGTKLELGNGTKVLNTNGGCTNIVVGGGDLIIQDGVLIQTADGVAYRNIHAIAEFATTITMNGGVIEGGVAPNHSNESERHGGNIWVQYNGAKRIQPVTININGGIITGGSTVNGNGGNLYLDRNATVTISGDAVISDGYATGYAGNLYVTRGDVSIEGDARITGGTCGDCGGNVYVIGATDDTANLTISGNAQVVGGVSGVQADNTRIKKNGGNVFAQYDTVVTLSDNAKILGGDTKDSGGALYANAIVNISDNAEISGGTAVNSGGKNLFIVNGQLHMSGGFIDGSASITRTSTSHDAKVVLSGKPVIANNGTGLVLNAGTLITVDGALEAGSEVYVRNTGIISTAGADNATNYQYIHHVSEPVHNTYCVDAAMVTASGADYYGMTADHVNTIFIGQYRCVCGATGTEHLGTCGDKLLWRPWTEGNKLPEESGNFYLTKKVSVVDGQSNCYLRGESSSKPNTARYDIVIDLNGYDIERGDTSSRVFDFAWTNDVHLTLCNSYATKGQITAAKKTVDQGAIIWGGKELNFYNVKIDGSKLTLNKEKPYLFGALISTSANTGMFGNTEILGGDSIRGTCAIEISGASRLTFDPTVVIDGEITLGNAAKINMAGITDASAYTVNASGAFTSGNTITDSAKFFASNTEAQIFLEGKEQFAGLKYCVCGGEGGKHTQFKDANGNTVGCDGTLLNWRPHRAVDSIPNSAGNWYLTCGVVITKNDNVNFSSAINYSLNLNGYSVAFNPSNGRGYRLFRLRNNNGTNYKATLNLTDFDMATGKKLTSGKVSATIATGENGTIFWLTGADHTVNVYGGTFDASGVTMAASRGGNLAYLSSGTFNQFGGTLIGGATGTNTNGGTIHTSFGATYNLFDGIVEGGRAVYGTSGGQGGNFNVQGTLNIYGGTVRDGVSKDNIKGNNIMVTSTLNNKTQALQIAELNIYGGTIAGGVNFNTYYGKNSFTLSGRPVIDKELTSDGVAKPTASLTVDNVNDDFDASGLTDGAKIYISGSGRFAVNGSETVKSYFHTETADKIVLHGGSELHFGKTYCLCGASKHGSDAHAYWCDGEHSWVEWDGQKDFTLSGYYYLNKAVTETYQRIVGNGKALDVVVDLNGCEWKGSNRAVRLDAAGDSLGITDSSAFEADSTKRNTGKLTGGFNNTGDQSGVILISGNCSLNLYAGTIEHRGDAKVKEGGIIAVNGNSVFNMYGGTLSGGTATYGGNLFIRKDATFNYYGGSIEGGTATYGGNVYVDAGGNFNVYVSDKDTGLTADRLISGGVANSGGNIYTKGNVNIEAATISGGAAIYNANGATGDFGRGGNLYIDGGQFTLSNGAKVEKGYAVSKTTSAWTPGGNIYANSGTMTVENATITGGQDTEEGLKQTVIDGNNIYINFGMTVYLKEGALVENTANNANENILMQGGKLYLQGGVISVKEGITEVSNILTNTSWKSNHPTDSSKWPYIKIESGEIKGGKQNIALKGGSTVEQTGGAVHSATLRNVYLDARESVTKDGTTYYGVATYTMTGGKVYGDKSTTTASGANFYLGGAYATLTVEGTAEVYGGTANEGDGGNIKLGNAAGVNATIQGNAKVYDGTNTTTKTSDKPNGGSVWVGKQATLLIAGNAQVYGGKTCNGGGNIYNNGTITIQDSAKVFDALNSDSSANIFNVGGTLNMEGGSVAGGIRMHNGTIKLSGAPVIDRSITTNGKVPSTSLSLNTGVVIDATGLTGGTVYVTGTTGEKIADNADVHAQDYILSETKMGSLIVPTDWVESEKTIYLGVREDTYCVCGASREGNAYTCQCDGSKKVWLRWEKKNELPTASGYYYLAYDVELTAETVATLETKGVQIAIDLRGNDIKLDGDEKLYELNQDTNVKIILTDSSETDDKVGSVIKTGESLSDGGILQLKKGTSFEFYRVTLDASGYTGTYATSNNFAQGGALAVFTGGNVVMHSGTIIGGTACEGGAVFMWSSNASLDTTFTMKSGTITGGIADNASGNARGGNLSVSTGTTFIMEGGKIVDGVAKSGAANVMVSGANTKFIMNGGKILDGSVTGTDAGGNIRIQAAATFELNDGTISGGKVGTSVTHEAANILVQGNSVLNVKGGTIYGGVTMQSIDANQASIELSGKPVINGSLNATPCSSITFWTYKNSSYTGSVPKPVVKVTAALETGSYIGINAKDTLISSANAEANTASLSAFHDESGVQNIYVINQTMVDDCAEFEAADLGKLYIGQIHCVCGGLMADHGAANELCDGKLHVWTAIAARPTFKQLGTNDKSFYYYLTADVMGLNTESGFDGNHGDSLNGGTAITNRQLYLDLNGFNMGSTASRMFVARDGNISGCSINLLNTKSDDASVIQMTGTHDQGALYWGVTAGCAFRVYNVQIQSDMSNNSKAHYGGLFAIGGGSGTYLWMKNVIITSDSTAASTYRNEILAVSTSAELIDCTISGANGIAPALLLAGTSLRLENCTITGNVGGGMLVERGTLTLAGNTTITGNTAGNSAKNLYVTNGKSGDKILNGYVVLEDGFTGSFGLDGDSDRNLINSITTWENALLTGGKITLDDATNDQFMVWDNGLGLTSVKNIVQCACGGKAVGVGDHQCKKLVFTPWTNATKLPTSTGNYYLTTTVNLDGQQSFNNATAQTVNIDLHGNNVNAKEGSRTLLMQNGNVLSFTDSTGAPGTVTGDYATNGNCGSFLMSNSTLNIYNGIFTLTADANPSSGGVIEVTGSTLNMYGGTITGGHVTGYGGNVNVGGNGIFNLYAGTVTDGRATNGGGNIQIAETATFNMFGGTVTKGYDKINTNGSPNYGRTNGNINCNGKIEMSGGTITGATQLNGTATMKVSGKVTITGNNGLSVCKDSQLSVGTLDATSKIALFMKAENYFKDGAWPVATSIFAVAADDATLDLNNFSLSVYRASTLTDAQKAVNFELKIEDGKLILAEKSN